MGVLSAIANPVGAQAVTNTGNMLTGLQGLQALKDFQARQALAGIYGQAINPTTGQLDVPTYNRLLAQSPAALWNAGPSMQQAGQAGIAQGGAGLEQLRLAGQRYNAIASFLTPEYQAAMRGEAVPGTALAAKAQQAVTLGLVPPEAAAPVIAAANKIGDGNAADLVTGISYMSMDAGQRLSQIQSNQQVVAVHMSDGTERQVPLYQVPGLVAGDPGARVIGPAPQGGRAGGGPVSTQSFGPSGGRYPTTVTPGTRNPPESIPPPAGGGGPTPAPSGGGPQTPTTQAPAPTPAPVRTAGPAAPTQTDQPIWAQPPPPSVAPPPVAGVTAAPGTISAQQPGWEASGKAAAQLQTRASASRGNISLYDDMQTQLNTPGWQPGLGATVGSTWNQILQRLHLAVDPGNTQGMDVSTGQRAQEQFEKDSALLAGQQTQELGNPSDARQELAAHSRPGMLISKFGNRGIISMLKGNEYAIRAENDAWAQAQTAGWQAKDFNTWRSRYFLGADKATGGEFDPRLFWMANMSPEEQRTYANGIAGKTAQDQLFNNAQYALRMGWITQGPDGTFVMAQP